MSKNTKAGKSPVDLLNAAKAAKADPEKSKGIPAETEEVTADDIDFAGLAETPVADVDPEPTDALPGEEDELETAELVDDEPVAPISSNPEPVTSERVVFISRDPEKRCFPVNLIRAGWHDTGNRLRWRVPAGDADAFRNHPHVKSGRIIELA
jgi:hypothetical protein